MPYVALILVDALRADHLGSYAGSDVGTPNADRLGREGVVFLRAIAQASSTRPSVASLMTGLYPSQHGLADRWTVDEKGALAVSNLDPSVPTLAELLSAGGVTTAAFLGGNANMKPLFGLTRGFMTAGWHPTTDGDVITTEFERFLATARPERAFCYLHYMDVHHPLPETIPSRLDAGLDPAAVSSSMADLLDAYAEAVRLTDTHLGRVLAAMERAGVLEDAMVVLTADHGEELGEHGGVLAHGRTLYRELVNVPLIVRMPGAARAGTIVGRPVQLIDLMPTILEHFGRPPRETPGRSLLPLMAGTGTAEPYAFSELLRRDRYCQSVVTPTHQLIERFILEETAPVQASALRPGMPVQVKGEPTSDGIFIPTKVSLKGDRSAKVRGIVDAVDASAGVIEVFGLRLVARPETRFIGLGKEPFTLAELTVDEKVSVSFAPQEDGSLVATKVKRRKTGGKSKLEGAIEEVREVGGDLRVIRVLGIDVPVHADATISPLREKREDKRSKADALSRVLAGDFVARERELFDTESDPREADDLAERETELASRLESLLASWTASLVSGVKRGAGEIDVDPETLEQLRRMGYVD